MRSRSLAVAAATASLTLAGVVAAPIAMAGSHPSHGHGRPAVSASPSVSDSETPTPGHKEQSHKAVRVHFAAVGQLTAVDLTGKTITVKVAHGDRVSRGTSLVVTVTTKTRITRRGAHRPLSALVVGDKVTVVGLRSATGATAVQITAVPKGHPVTSPSPAPSPSVEPSASAEPTEDPAPSSSPSAPLAS